MVDAGDAGGRSLTSVERVLTNLLTSLNTHPSGVVVFDRLIVPKEVQCVEHVQDACGTLYLAVAC